MRSFGAPWLFIQAPLTLSDTHAQKSLDIVIGNRSLQAYPIFSSISASSVPIQKSSATTRMQSVFIGSAPVSGPIEDSPIATIARGSRRRQARKLLRPASGAADRRTRGRRRSCVGSRRPRWSAAKALDRHLPELGGGFSGETALEVGAGALST